jgi:hypothetical protein
LAALAVEGDDSSAAAMQAAILTSFNTWVGGPTGILNHSALGGYPIEGFNYGQAHFMRLIQYMNGMKTAGKPDLLATNGTWIRTAAKSLLYNLKPDMWSVTDEGGFTGDYSRILTQNYPLFLASILTKYGPYVEGQWMQWMLANIGSVPVQGGTPATYKPSVFESFFYNFGAGAVKYSDQPTAYFSLGDKHLYVRENWSSTSAYMTFNGGSMTTNIGGSNHQNKTSGHIQVQRGSDYLLIGTSNWFGSNGITGNPRNVSDLGPNWKFNTLFYWDGGTSAGGTCLDQTLSGGQYAGCQMFWGLDNAAPRHLETQSYSFSKADLRPAYLNNAYGGGTTTLSAYNRTFLNIGGDVAFVVDRITSTIPSSTRNLFWHTPTLNTAAIPGNATSISINGSTASVTVGGSVLWISTVLPASPSITQATDETAWGSGTSMGTQRFVVSDPNPIPSPSSLFLTVLATAGASGSSVPSSGLIDTGNYKGVFYNDGGFPRIALFSADEQPQIAVTYTAAYVPQLTGHHVILDLKPGFYTVQKDGAILFNSILVGKDGSLSFTCSGGTTYTVTQTALPTPAFKGKGTIAGRAALK